MNPLASLGLKAGAVLLAFGGLFAWHMARVDAAVKAEGDRVTALWNEDRGRLKDAALKAQAAAAAETERRLAAQKEVQDVAEKRFSQARADADRLATANASLHDAVAAAVARSGGSPGNPAAAGLSAPAAALGTVLEACVARYADVARAADEAIYRGSECTADYDALGQHPASSTEGSE